MKLGLTHTNVGAVVRESRTFLGKNLDQLAKMTIALILIIPDHSIADLDASLIEAIESGESDIEFYVPLFGTLAALYEVPMRTLIVGTQGRRGEQRAYFKRGMVGALLRRARIKAHRTVEEVAVACGCGNMDVRILESRKSPLEVYAGIILVLAELCDIGVYSFVYPGHQLPRKALIDCKETNVQFDVD